jgi:hypothetical protein
MICVAVLVDPDSCETRQAYLVAQLDKDVCNDEDGPRVCSGGLFSDLIQCAMREELGHDLLHDDCKG